MPIYDFTNEFKLPNVVWSRGGRKFLDQFNDHIQQTTRGVYILFAANDSDVDIVDRNKHQKPGGRVNVPARGMVVKFGKYESGIALRERTNYQHWHRRPNGVEEAGIFPSCIAMLLVANFDDKRTGVRAEEQVLKLAVRRLLDDKEWTDPTQASRHPKMEARWIPPSHRNKEAEIEVALRELFKDLAKNRGW